MQERACCHVTLAGKLRVECKTTKICVKINDICTELILTWQSIITNMLSLPNAKQHPHTHNNVFKRIHTKPVHPLSLGSQCSWGESLLGRLRPTHPYYDRINLFFSCWGGGCRGRGKRTGKTDGMRQDMYEEGSKKKKGNLRRGWALQDKQNALKWERWR